MSKYIRLQCIYIPISGKWRGLRSLPWWAIYARKLHRQGTVLRHSGRYMLFQLHCRYCIIRCIYIISSYHLFLIHFILCNILRPIQKTKSKRNQQRQQQLLPEVESFCIVFLLLTGYLLCCSID